MYFPWIWDIFWKFHVFRRGDFDQWQDYECTIVARRSTNEFMAQCGIRRWGLVGSEFLGCNLEEHTVVLSSPISCFLNCLTVANSASFLHHVNLPCCICFRANNTGSKEEIKQILSLVLEDIWLMNYSNQETGCKHSKWPMPYWKYKVKRPRVFLQCISLHVEIEGAGCLKEA